MLVFHPQIITSIYCIKDTCFFTAKSVSLRNLVQITNIWRIYINLTGFNTVPTFVGHIKNHLDNNFMTITFWHYEDVLVKHSAMMLSQNGWQINNSLIFRQILLVVEREKFEKLIRSCGTFLQHTGHLKCALLTKILAKHHLKFMHVGEIKYFFATSPTGIWHSR